jgi:hypothetical protein
MKSPLARGARMPERLQGGNRSYLNRFAYAGRHRNPGNASHENVFRLRYCFPSNNISEIYLDDGPILTLRMITWRYEYLTMDTEHQDDEMIVQKPAKKS